MARRGGGVTFSLLRESLDVVFSPDMGTQTARAMMMTLMKERHAHRELIAEYQRNFDRMMHEYTRLHTRLDAVERSCRASGIILPHPPATYICNNLPSHMTDVADAPEYNSDDDHASKPCSNPFAPVSRKWQ